MKWIQESVLVGPKHAQSAAALSPDGSILACGFQDRSLWIWRLPDPNARSPTVLLPQGGVARCDEMDFHPTNGHLVLVARTLAEIDPTDGSQLFQVSSTPRRFAISEDGSSLALGFSQHRLEIWDYAKRKALYELRGPPNPDPAKAAIVSTLCFSPEGNLLASGAEDGRLHVWDLGKRRLILTLPGHRYAVGKTRFSPSGDRLFSTGEMDRAICWDIPSGKELWASHGGGTLALSQDGNLLAVGGANPVRLYNASDGTPIETLDHMHASSLFFTPDASGLIGVGGNKVQIWRRIGPEEHPLSMLLDSEAWFYEFTEYLTRLGFFHDLRLLSREDRADEIRRRHHHEHSYDLPKYPRSSLDHLIVLAQDKARVWWNDLEADVSPSNKVYVRTLKELGQISAGYFTPLDIEETWATDAGPLTVRFSSNGNPVKLTPEYQGDYIDIGILRDLNHLLLETPIRFELYQPFDQTAYVVSLTADQKTALTHQLGWSFQDVGGFPDSA